MALSKERSCAEALMMACDERLGAQSPAALMVCDTFLARDLWMSFVHDDGRVGSAVYGCGQRVYGQLGLPPTAPERRNEFFPAPIALQQKQKQQPRVKAVACGSAHSAVVLASGELLVAGHNGRGQLGLGDKTHRHAFEPLLCSAAAGAFPAAVVSAVACGGFHTLALLESGELFVFGENNRGQLGIGDPECEIRTRPEKVEALGSKRVTAIAAGQWHSMAIVEAGELFSWGCNELGQLGVGGFSDKTTPTLVSAFTAQQRVIAISCGNSHSAALVEGGVAFAWGENEDGQVGPTNPNNHPVPTRVCGFPPRSEVVAIACGGWHTLALLATGDVYAWGGNGLGELGLGVRLSTAAVQKVPVFKGEDGGKKRVKAIFGGLLHTAFLLDSGEVLVCGSNTAGQLGIGITEGRVRSPEPLTALAEKHVLSIALGSEHSLFLVQ